MSRIFVAIPMIVLLLLTSMVFLVAKAPRTWAAHWTAPVSAGTGGGGADFGAAGDRGGWDFLWINQDTDQVEYSVRAANRPARSIVVDAGDVLQPSLVAVGRDRVGVWVHNFNGFTALRIAVFAPNAAPRVRTILSSPHPLEHPYVFSGPRGAAELVFSWQRYGNADVFQSGLNLASLRPGPFHRLTHSAIYGFYPRAVLDTNGDLAVIHLESCCRQEVWNVVFDRYDLQGHHLGPTQLLAHLDYGQHAPDPSRWGEDIRRAPDGTIWGAFAGVSGVWLFHVGRDGRMLQKPALIGSDSEAPSGIALALTGRANVAFWEEPFSLGSYIESREFGPSFQLGGDERVEYLSNAQIEPHAAVTPDGRPVVVWQTVGSDLTTRFNSAESRAAVTPSIAQRLGLGLADPWQAAAVLTVGAFGLAALLTTVNVFFVVGIALLGMLLMRGLRQVPGRWAIYALLLSISMYLIFVAPGVPTLFLASLPSMGFAIAPFGILAVAGSLFFVSWVGQVSLRRIDDVYRAGIMAFMAMYFFAFVETAVFIQQRLGVI